MANAVIGSLRANLGLDSSKFQKGARGVRDPLKSMKRQFVAVAGAAAAFGTAITAAALKGANQIDKLAKSARRVDGSIGGFRAIVLAADEAGVSVSGLTNDVQTMNRELSRAGEGGPVDDALAKLGLSAEHLLSLDIDERLAVIADRIKELGLTSGQATAILQDFGVRNREMALLMVQGGDAIRDARGDVQDYGLALNAVDSAQIEHANDQMSRLSIVSEYFGQQLALVIVPALGNLAEAFTDSMREGGLLRTMIDGFASNLVRISTYIGTVVTLLGVRLVWSMGAAAIATGSLSAAFVTLKGAIARTGLGLVAVGIGELVYRLGFASDATDDLSGAADTASTAENALAGALGGVSANGIAAAGNSRDLAEAHKASATAALAAAESELKLQKARIAAAGAQLDADYGLSVGDHVEEYQAAVAAQEGLMATISAIEAEIIATQEKINGIDTAAAAEALNAQETAVDQLTDSLAPAEAAHRLYTKTVLELSAALSDNLITAEDYNRYMGLAADRLNGVTTASGGAARATSALGDELDALPDQIDNIEAATDGLANTFASTFTDIFAGTQTVIGGLAQLAGQLGRMALMKGFEGMFENLLGGTGTGNFLSDLFGFNANGTEDWRGGMTVVGERGPEIVNLPRGSQVFNAQKSAQMMTGQVQAAPQVTVSPKIINLFDMSTVGDWMSGPAGEEIILNVMSRNGYSGA